jgi:hypothetical protein
MSKDKRQLPVAAPLNDIGQVVDVSGDCEWTVVAAGTLKRFQNPVSVGQTSRERSEITCSTWTAVDDDDRASTSPIFAHGEICH